MAASIAPARRLLTIEEFNRAGAAGVYDPDEKLELIEGEVYRKVSPQESEHSTAIRLVEIALSVVFESGHDVRSQMPLELGSYSKPEPDVAAVKGSIRDYAKKHPTTAVLVVEVSDTTLHADRSRKAAMYAKAGIEEYWILNLKERMLEVYREPAAVKGLRFDHTYLSTTRRMEADAVSPLAVSGSSVNVRDLLP